MKHPRTHVAAELGVVLLLVLAVVLAACSGGDDSSSSPSADGAGQPADGGTDAPAPIETHSSLGKVRGQLPKGKRSKVRQQVAHAVDEWFDAAYVGGDYPRNDFSTSWPGFTTGAKADASDDKELMSNQDIGAEVSSVKATARRVYVDVLAVRGKAEGATARFVLKFKTDGDVQRKVEVSGRLFLTPSAEGWRIFGYDVTKGRFA
ncbi:hypothetical protein ISU07_05440 [Nocardioides islandensis]|uniref:Lipoprotein n=1 Tax=Nocardioides islandensis TaxID=433663 RepID=A0A930VDF8_9ACTN|nr:hypothetical protein [Nocardioides islandensis]MBF4762561.1 hypothetical protein [Nocardioides islandensis]